MSCLPMAFWRKQLSAPPILPCLSLILYFYSKQQLRYQRQRALQLLTAAHYDMPSMCYLGDTLSGSGDNEHVGVGLVFIEKKKSGGGLIERVESQGLGLGTRERERERERRQKTWGGWGVMNCHQQVGSTTMKKITPSTHTDTHIRCEVQLGPLILNWG